MRIKRAKIATVDEIYFLVDKCGKVVMPVYRYMLFLRLNGRSINTNLVYCKHLKLFYEWLDLKEFDCYTVIKNRSSIISNLANFKFWIKYPTYNEKLIPIGGFEQKRSSSTINQIMNAVLNFYDFLAGDCGCKNVRK